jgi:hypothetical protein
LPFFTDTIGSTLGFPGFSFEPSFGTGETVGSTTIPGWPGAWSFSIFDGTNNGEAVFGDVGSINGPNSFNGSDWHSLIYVIDRVNGASVYLDGVAAHQNIQAGSSVVGIGNINSTNSATIGQDPTGVYPQPGSANIDDLGVWNRALTPLEAASIFTAGSINQLSFVGVTNATPTTLSAKFLPGSQLQLSWSAGTLQSTTNLLNSWTNVAGVTSPFTTNVVGRQQFFRLKD